MRAKAKKQIPKFAFEYLDGGCNDDVNLKKNTLRIRDIELKPKYLVVDELVKKIKNMKENKKYLYVSEEIDNEQKNIQNLNLQKPENWKETYKQFNNYLKKETVTKMKYRRLADKGYQ